MTDFVDPNVIAQITAAKDELVAEVNKISSNSDVIEQYADSLPSPLVGEAPVDGEVYGRKDKDWVKVSSSGGEAVWGGIQGTLADQTDLQAVLDTKVEDGDLADVATSGKYNDLIGAPTVLPEAPEDGKQYVRKDAAWAESELPPLVDTVVTGSFTQQESTSPSAIKAQWFTPSSSKYGFHFQGAAWGGDKYKFLTDKDGVYHQEDGYAERRLAFLDEIDSSGGDGTNLGIIHDSTKVIVTSSTGDNAIIPHVSTTSNTGDWGGRGNAGVMSVADKQKLDSLGDFDGELDEPLRLNGDAANYTMVEGADTTASGYTTAIKGYGAANPFSSTTLQYTTNIKVDGVYHTDNSNSGSERRLAFIDEVSGGGDSGVEEAPEDGKQYARQDATWTEVVDSGIEEAPEDGKQYARKNAAWSEVVSEGGASTFTELSDTPANYTAASGKVVAVNSAGNGLEFIDAPSGGGAIGIDYSQPIRVEDIANVSYGTLRPTNSQWANFKNKQVVWKGIEDNGYAGVVTIRLESDVALANGWVVGDSCDFIVGRAKWSGVAGGTGKVFKVQTIGNFSGVSGWMTNGTSCEFGEVDIPTWADSIVFNIRMSQVGSRKALRMSISFI